MIDKNEISNLPEAIQEFIDLIIKKMKYRRKVRQEVRQELIGHFEDELKDCKDDKEKEEKAKMLIENFGDVKMLGKLLRRAKKRCRPLWRTALVHLSQVFALIIVYLIICLIPLIIGEPTVNTDYTVWLNEFVRAGRNEDDNARFLYDRAINHYINEPNSIMSPSDKWPAEWNNTEFRILSRWLDENKETIETIRKAANKPYYWANYKLEKVNQQSDGEDPPVIGPTHSVISPISQQTMQDSDVLTQLLSKLAAYRGIVYVLKTNAFIQAYKGNIEQALNDIRALQQFGLSMQDSGLLIEQLVGIATESISYDTLTTLLTKVEISAELLEKIQHEFEKNLENKNIFINIEAEKVFYYDQIQRTFTDDGRGSGKMLIRAVPFVVNDFKDMIFKLTTFNFPDKKEAISQVDSFFENANELIKTPPYKNEKINGIIADLEKSSPLVMHVLIPSYKHLNMLSWRSKVYRTSTLTILAIKRYENEKGSYPETLEQLIKAGLIKEIPLDPFSDKTLAYKKTDNDFVLYSVGLNFVDDGGEVAISKLYDKPKMWADHGDAVFWPVQKN